jgi:hypothetical protein
MTTIQRLDSLLGIQGQEKRNGYRESREVRAPCLFVHDHVGQVLQRPVRGHGKKRPTLIVRVRTQDAKARRPENGFSTAGDFISNS